MYGDVVVAVVAAVLVVKADGVHQLVDDSTYIDAAIDVKRDALLASDTAHVGPAPAGGQQ